MWEDRNSQSQLMATIGSSTRSPVDTSGRPTFLCEIMHEYGKIHLSRATAHIIIGLPRYMMQSRHVFLIPASRALQTSSTIDAASRGIAEPVIEARSMKAAHSRRYGAPATLATISSGQRYETVEPTIYGQDKPTSCLAAEVGDQFIV